MKKLINATFEVENEYQEGKLWSNLEGMGAKYIKTLPNTDHLKEKTHYKKLSKDVQTAKDNLYKYINNNRK